MPPIKTKYVNSLLLNIIQLLDAIFHLIIQGVWLRIEKISYMKILMTKLITS